MGFYFIFCPVIYCQQQTILDSLLSVYESGRFKKKDKLLLQQKIIEYSKDPEVILTLSEKLIKAAQEEGSSNFLCVGYSQKGNAFKLKGDNSKALENYFEASKIARGGHQQGALYISIADIYSNMGNHTNAFDYYQKALAILKKYLNTNLDSVTVANALYNLGDEYIKVEKWDSALLYTKESQLFSNKANYKIGDAYSLGSLGTIYSKLGKDLEAEQNLNKSIALLEELNEYNAICEFLIFMSDIYQGKKDIGAAKKYAGRSLELAQKYGLKQEISNGNLKLSKLYEKTGDQQKALSFYKDFVMYRDSVSNLESVQKVADLRTDFEVSEKQKEVDLLETRNKLRIAERNGFVFASLLLAALLIASVYFYTQKVKRNKMMAAQKIQEAEINHQKDLLQSVITSQEAERKRIGMDLHDEVGAALSTLRIKIEKNTGESVNAGVHATNLKLDIDKIITNMRNISHSLSPRISGSFGFYDAVHELSDNVNRSGKINMAVHFDEDKLPEFANEQAPMAIYRVLSELINNTLKHAAAKNIQMNVDVADDKMEIQYHDDGIGISQKNGTTGNGMGMQNIESRLSIIGADWQIQNPETGGYGVIISVPLK